MIRRVLIPLVAGFVLFSALPVRATPLEPAAFPSLESAIRIRGPLTFCGERVPLEDSQVRERLEKELLLMLWDRAQIILYLKRSTRFFPHIERVFSGAGLPSDLKYVAVIESALLSHAGSHAGARGVWQFIRSTGRNYGLTVNRYIDDRRNFHFATRAAARYFRDLYGMFGSWTMACAAYNMGEKGLERRVRQQKVSNYYRLHLPLETQRYMLRAIAAKIILSDPARFGFRLEPRDHYPPIRFDRVRLKTRWTVPVVVIAEAAKTDFKGIKDLNPQLLDDVVPGGDHSLFLPEGAARNFAKRFQPLIEKYRASYRGKSYTVRRGDTLSAIARKHGMPLSRLLKLNGMHRRSTIHPGQKLVIMK
ncbi:lytic transglycosylase domain-containing protein [Pseudodesulfovibrio tunisiensis]|uniref:lytic transglycosylase domain-containing protein n=1 Tax=Pseudodesulfovibrio tunisiensis TaxID=463192 RepID=UPI001FB3B909|nr:lytic transglycosylase domain-containing protein [Pseudodesulfovibrio tunisiensis]